MNKNLVLLSCLIAFSALAAGCKDQPVNPTGLDEAAIKRDVLAELTLARTQPSTYAGLLRQMRSRYSGVVYTSPDGTKITTQEGAAAVDEAIAFCDTAAPRPALSSSNCLAIAAADHVNDTGPKGLVGHTGSDGSSVQTRIDRHCTGWGTIGETIAYGNSTPREIVLQLLVDDGVPNRGHRSLIYDRDFLTVGVGFGAHTTFRYMCVIDWADTVVPKMTIAANSN